jgi:hypothetical protein
MWLPTDGVGKWERRRYAEIHQKKCIPIFTVNHAGVKWL